jgi:hypothetical protein
MLICCGALGFAQEPAAGTEKTVQTGTAPAEKRQYLQRVIEVKNGEVKALGNLLTSLSPGHTIVVPHPDLKVISIGTYDPEFLKLAEEIVKRYDVARQSQPAAQEHDIEVVAYILVASPKGTAGDALPAELEGVAKQLRSLFGYRDLKLVDSALIRTREDHAGEVSGSALGLVEGASKAGPSDYKMGFKGAEVRAGEKGNVIELSNFHFYARLVFEASPGPGSFSSTVSFETDLSIADSQKVVVGKSKIGSGDQALILVLTARVVE